VYTPFHYNIYLKTLLVSSIETLPLVTGFEVDAKFDAFELPGKELFGSNHLFASTIRRLP